MDESIQEHLRPYRENGSVKLSEAIRVGRQMLALDQERHYFRLCALGCAFAGITGRQMTYEEQQGFYEGDNSNEQAARRIAVFLGIPEEVGELVHYLHFEERVPALEIADQLESRGL